MSDVGTLDLERIKRQPLKWTPKFDSTFKLINKHDFFSVLISDVIFENTKKRSIFCKKFSRARIGLPYMEHERKGPTIGWCAYRAKKNFFRFPSHPRGAPIVYNKEKSRKLVEKRVVAGNIVPTPRKCTKT